VVKPRQNARSRAAKAPAEEPIRLKDAAYEQLRELVLSGQLGPDEWLSERRLVEALGMSKTPIRVALERLENEGFIEILPQRGVRLRALTDEEILDYYDFRIALEAWSVRRACATADEADVAALRAIVTHQLDLLPPEPRADERQVDVLSYIEQDAALHDLLATIAGNGEVVRALRNGRDKLARVLSTILLRNPGWLRSTTGEHVRIVDAVARGEADAAEREITAHLEAGKLFLRGALADGHI
jgi:DNA-binding GntR family transcriptional regulator